MVYLLLDTASLYWRSYFALPGSITAPDGTPINALRGLIDTLSTLVERRHPQHIVACWDNDWRPQWRVDAVPTYKAHRADQAHRADKTHQADAAETAEEEVVPDTLTPQIPLIAQLLPLLGVCVHGVDGWEADDVIARLASSYATAGSTTVSVDIASGDRDLLQLVTQHVSVLYTGGTAKTRGGEPWLVMTPAEVAAKYGVSPDQYALLATLRGDPSDGLPGVHGVGERTAVRLIEAFSDLAGILAAAAQPTPPRPLTPRLSQLLVAGQASLRAAYSITQLRADTAISVPDHFPVADQGAALAFADTWGVRRSVERFLHCSGRR
ncbi:MAG: 5'-3' exonuclease [Candidatus Nanopelagicales bacterium]